ncbi:DNA-processing protein DprA [Clostridium sp. WILCCON 0269]|uniref:DNA-processing protein DprA n=1 Tax=Candidatus Clostridium eludens TaxID=3381663 RepID=A0ABW8SL57_9CLOT
MNVYDLWFASVRISNKIKINILKKFKSMQEIYEQNICNNSYIYSSKNCDKIYMELNKAWDMEKLKSMLEYCFKEEIKTVNFYEKEYPEKLKNYEDCPAVLFYKGNIEKLNTNLSVAIVGARNCSFYGENAASLISKEISVNNINVISGMARGIDSCAHRACVENAGYTCGVLGSGVDVIYPAENKKLYGNISKDGCVLSEFIPKTKPYPYNFPLRNRIISGLSDLVIIVEAEDRSGALITASCALEQGKDVMAVPGSIFSSKSKGTNKLIRDGAYVFTCLEDLFQLLSLQYRNKNHIKEDKLNDKEEKIFKIIGQIPIHIDEICRITNVDIKQLYELLFELQLKNKIMCLSGNYYVKIESAKSIIK